MKGVYKRHNSLATFGEKAAIIRGMNYIFNQGQYEGCQVSDVAIEDPDYIQGQIDNFNSQFTQEVLDLL